MSGEPMTADDELAQIRAFVDATIRDRFGNDPAVGLAQLDAWGATTADRVRHIVPLIAIIHDAERSGLRDLADRWDKEADQCDRGGDPAQVYRDCAKRLRQAISKGGPAMTAG